MTTSAKWSLAALPSYAVAAGCGTDAERYALVGVRDRSRAEQAVGPHISFRTIEMGVRPGLTIAILRNSLPKSTARTAARAVCAMCMHATRHRSKADTAGNPLLHRCARCCLAIAAIAVSDY